MHVRQRLGASERHACHVLGQPRSTQRRVKKLPGDEEALRTDVIRLASRFGRYGYRQITNLLRIEGWEVNHKRMDVAGYREFPTGSVAPNGRSCILIGFHTQMRLKSGFLKTEV